MQGLQSRVQGSEFRFWVGVKRTGGVAAVPRTQTLEPVQAVNV